MVLKIALDFDNTITQDVYLWSVFVSLFTARGHEVKVVTFRNNNGHFSNKFVDDFAKGLKIEVIYTEAQRKREYCASVGFYPDVWIDDMPELIVAENSYVPGEMLAQQLAIQDKEE